MSEALTQDAYGAPWSPGASREGMVSVRIMGPEGHTEVLFAPASQEQVDAVAARIRDLQERGYGVFATDSGGAGTMLRDPAQIGEFEKVMVAPPMAGG